MGEHLMAWDGKKNIGRKPIEPSSRIKLKAERVWQSYIILLPVKGDKNNCEKKFSEDDDKHPFGYA